MGLSQAKPNQQLKRAKKVKLQVAASMSQQKAPEPSPGTPSSNAMPDMEDATKVSFWVFFTMAATEE